MIGNVIVANNVSKEYPGKSNFWGRLLGIKSAKNGTIAVQNFNLQIKKGEFYGLLGPNGAGKTTIIRMLSGILRPTSGSLSIMGKDIFKNEKYVKSKLGIVLGGERSLYWKLTGEENLRFFASLYGLSKHVTDSEIKKVLEYVSLTHRKDDFVEEYSKGMKQRLLIAKALLHKPEVLLLDEPTVGLDVKSAIELRKLLKHLNKDFGVSVILTTHYLYEAEQLCDRIGILRKGQIINEGTAYELKNLVKNDNIIELKVKQSCENVKSILCKIDFVKRVTEKDNDLLNNAKVYEIIYSNNQNNNEINLIVENISKVTQLVSIKTKMPTIEDVFIRLTDEGCEAINV
ncbi:MAG: ABC transporter ATP-binding protein [Halanaerobiales bacterium]|nr:ABC transporter ATP-binding protein [Halanaerobiales bacterium]